MNIPRKRLVAMQGGRGTIKVHEQDLPELTKGAVLVKVAASLVSPGTEVGGWHSFAGQRKSPVPREEHLFGYSNSGIVIEAGEGVSEFKPGDRVACVGAGYALHSDYAVVPQNLCITLPDTVSFEQGTYAMLFATALQTLRRGQPEFGEYSCVVGLGIVGLLTSRLYQLAGNYVIGWDNNPAHVARAQKWGIEAVNENDGVPTTSLFTHGDGLDAGVLAIAGECDDTVNRLVESMKRSPDGHPMGRIMIVGWPSFTFGSKSLIGGMNNIDIRRCSRTGAGYHDDVWERGADYPPVFMRWTTKSNLKLCMRLISEGKVDVDALTTHKMKLSNVEKEIDKALDDPDSMLGVVFEA